MIIFSAILVLTTFSLPNFPVKFFPDGITSPEKALRLSRNFEVVPLKGYQAESTKFVAEGLDSPFWNATVLEVQNFTVKSPFVKVFSWALWSSGSPASLRMAGKNYTDTNWFPFYVRFKVFDENTQTFVEESEIYTIYWDFRVANLRFTYKIEDLGPCHVRVTPIPSDPELMKNVRMIMYIPYRYTGTGWTYDSGVGTTTNGVDENGNLSLVWAEGKPKATHWTVRIHSAHSNGRATSAGLVKTLPSADKFATEDVESTFNGATTHYMTRISNNWQFRITKKKVKVLENAYLFLPFLGYGQKASDSPTMIDVYLPMNMTMDFDNFDPKWDRVKMDNDTWNHYRLNRGSSNNNWVYMNGALPMAFKFSNTNIEIGKEYDMWVQIEDNAPQKLIIIPTETPKLTNFPKRIVSQFQWMGMGSFSSWQHYANLGFNQLASTKLMSYWPTNSEDIADKIPDHAYYKRMNESFGHYVDLSNGERFRMGYCPEISFFHSNVRGAPPYTPHYLYDMIGEISLPNIVPSHIPDTVADKPLELDKWFDAILFHNSTGYANYAYDGYFMKRQFEVLTEVMAYCKPEYVTFDIECFTSDKNLIPLMSENRNANNRRVGGETDLELHTRIIEEMFQGIADAVEAGSPGTKITYYDLRSDANIGYHLGDYVSYEKAGIIPQPSTYTLQKDILVSSILVRNNRQFLKGDVKELIPMPAPGTYGAYNLEYYVDFCFHIFAAGSTGVQYFGGSQTDDHSFYLGHLECLDIVSGFEDIFYEGMIGFHDFENITNLVVSAMKKDGHYFIALTKTRECRNRTAGCIGSARLKYPHKKYRIFDLRNKKLMHTRYNGGYVEFLFDLDSWEQWTVVANLYPRKKKKNNDWVYYVVGISVAVALVLVLCCMVCLLVIGISSVFLWKFKKKGKGEDGNWKEMYE